MKRALSYIILLFVSAIIADAQWKDTLDFTPDYSVYKFAERDTCFLYMDVYQPDDTLTTHPCIMFLFGGGFIAGQRDVPAIVKYCTQMSEKGYVVVSIDYRLGLKGVNKVGPTHSEPLEKALYMAVEDIYSATLFLLDNADSLRIDKNKIITIGSSAGAISVLQADYMQANRFPLAMVLPEDFHYAGVISFSGAIYSKNGKLKYTKHSPAPTFLLHGTSDKLVPYKKIRLFKLGFFGSKSIAKTFDANDNYYHIARFDDLGHEVASFFTQFTDETDIFIKEYVIKGRECKIDETIKHMNYTGPAYSRWTPDDLYKNQKK